MTLSCKHDCHWTMTFEVVQAGLPLNCEISGVNMIIIELWPLMGVNMIIHHWNRTFEGCKHDCYCTITFERYKHDCHRTMTFEECKHDCHWTMTFEGCKYACHWTVTFEWCKHGCHWTVTIEVYICLSFHYNLWGLNMPVISLWPVRFKHACHWTMKSNKMCKHCIMTFWGTSTRVYKYLSLN